MKLFKKLIIEGKLKEEEENSGDEQSNAEGDLKLLAASEQMMKAM